MLVSYLAYSSALKMEVTCCSEMLADFHWTAWHYIQEDRTLRVENCFTLYLISYKFMVSSSCLENFPRGM
jgi:hypothetical protein